MSELGRVSEVVCTYVNVLPAIGEVQTDTPTAKMRVECLQVTPGLLEDLCCVLYLL
jgi:hypothetical protein